MKIIALLPSSYYKDCDLSLIPTISLPDSAIVKNGNPVFLPDFDSSFSAIPFFAIKIIRLGKNIAPRFAERYFSEVAPVLLLRGDNVMSSLKNAGLPWNSAIGFDKSIVIGEFLEYKPWEEDSPLTICIDEKRVAIMPFPHKVDIDEVIYQVSRYNSLKMGDLILIPLDSDPLPLRIGTLVTIGNDKILLKLPLK
ncbi:MAG: 2-hydroxyhepta-2,4-diene-1,7-dioate isomerase [Muribaculaceae bacterium]|nr:2-hydroxyhepta-2,4-diene-1,7-dioate isomerase [Muribaculaceae bacterium]